MRLTVMFSWVDHRQEARPGSLTEIHRYIGIVKDAPKNALKEKTSANLGRHPRLAEKLIDGHGIIDNNVNASDRSDLDDLELLMNSASHDC